MTWSAVVRDSSSGSDRTRGRGHSLRTPETNDALAVVREPSSVSVNITRPDWLNTHTPPALITRKVSPPFYQR